MDRESRLLEYKREVTDYKKIAKTVIAFANGSGGQLIVGVTDKTRTVIGVSPNKIDMLLERLPVSLSDLIHPSIFPQVYVKTINNKEVIVLQVYPGSQKPYFLASEGKDKGVYIRVGAHTRRAEGEILNELRLQQTRMAYDEIQIQHCNKKELDLSLLPAGLKTQKSMLSLDILKHDVFSGDVHLTRGGILMFHNHPEKYVPEAFVICSRMRGNSGRNTIESYDITGSLPQQSEGVISLVKEWLGREPQITTSKYEHTSLALPVSAVREAVNNALFHRQYSIAGSIKVAYYTDRLEIFSPGHFAGPFIPASLGDGTSYIRNRIISSLARRLHLIEKRGTGIKLIMDSMAEQGLLQPQFEEGPNWFKVILRFTRIADIEKGKGNPLETILSMFESASEVTSANVCKKLDVSKATAVSYLDKLMIQNKIRKVGKGPKTRYVLSVN
ncbi:MAG: putative DNA binding domain-containing protein [Fibrobacteria bacterium]|nr:putative DNA binding domain-containing protein [Fibrobacteria bacterium]